MKFGLQTHFDGPLNNDPVLSEVRRRRFNALRIDGQNGDHGKMMDAIAEVLSHDFEPVPIIPVEQPEMMALFPAGMIVLLGNEHDPGGIGRQIAAADYRQLLDAACAIALQHPIRLFAPELSNLDQNSIDWLNAVKGAGWPAGMAGLSFHRYGRDANWDTPHTGFSSRAGEIKWLKAAAGDLPLACTEWGWGSKRGMNEQLQFDYTRREWVWYRDVVQVELAVEYQLNDGTADNEDFGIKDGDRWKPVADAIPDDVPAVEEPLPPLPDEPITDEPVDHLAGLLKIALRAANGNWVTAENGGDAEGVIRANKRHHDDVQAWQTFGVVPMADGRIALKTITGRFWCAENGGGQALVANRTKASIWEAFKPIGQLTHGGTLALQTFDGIHHVCCEVDNHDPVLVANRQWIQSWERFTVEVLSEQIGPIETRSGVVRSMGGCIVGDDQGAFRPLGLTFFWGLYGWKFERDRVLDHFKWMRSLAAQGAKIDYLRILGEVDWEGRTIDPNWDDYEPNLAGFADAAWAHGFRLHDCLIGGKNGRGLGMKVAEQHARVFNNGRQHMVAKYEGTNEFQRLNKIDLTTLTQIGKYLRTNTPNLVSLSSPRNADDEHDEDGQADLNKELAAAAKAAGVQIWTLHTRRADHDFGWAQARQPYDFASTSLIGDQGEPPGPQSSVAVCEEAVLLAMMRALGIYAGAPYYTFHAAQGVTGLPEPKYGRPMNMWEVPNIVPLIRATRQVEQLIPAGVENGRIVNNGRDKEHPLQLNDGVSKPSKPNKDAGFWEGKTPYGVANKNYAVLFDGNRFGVWLGGIKAPSDGQLVGVGQALRRQHMKAFDPVTLQLVKEETLDAGQWFHLPGRADTKQGYIVDGQFT